MEAIAAGGAGVGRLPDGRAVFVHRTAPGERVEVALTASKRSYARGRLLRVLTPAPERRAAPCPYYARCGGCTLEHLEYPAQLAAKGRLVRDGLERIGGVAVDVPDVTPSPDEVRYRNRISFALLRLPGGRVIAGFHELERPGRVLDMDGACLLAEPALAQGWTALRAAWGEGARRLPSGPRLRVTLRSTAAGALGLLVEGGYAPGRPKELLEAVPGLAAVWQRPEPGGPLRLLAGAEELEEEVGGERVRLRGDVFLQVNRAAAALLEAHVLELAGAPAGVRVVDGYCGVGRYARRLAALGARVTGIEWSGPAIAEARRLAGALAAGEQQGEVRFLEGSVEDRLGEALPADLVVLNPPRAGLDARVPDLLAAERPARLIYVSCDPATLARDLSRLGDGFRLASLRCFDLFPQTAHVETVALLEAVR